jgi:hypothetical protein
VYVGIFKRRAGLSLKAHLEARYKRHEQQFLQVWTALNAAADMVRFFALQP